MFVDVNIWDFILHLLSYGITVLSEHNVYNGGYLAKVKSLHFLMFLVSVW